MWYEPLSERKHGVCYGLAFETALGRLGLKTLSRKPLQPRPCFVRFFFFSKAERTLILKGNHFDYVDAVESDVGTWYHDKDE